jgi:hypothetical protein
MKPNGDPDEIREAINDIDRSLTYDEVISAIERAASASYQPQSPFDPYKRIANQLDWSKVKPVQEEQIQREEMLANAEMLRRAIQEGLITEEEAQLYLKLPESREEKERLQERIMELELKLQQKERELLDKITDYIRQRAIQLNLSPKEARRLLGEVNPSLSYNENLQLIEAALEEILRERGQPAPTPSPPPTPPPPQQPTPEQVRAELSKMGSRRLRDLGTALLAKDVEQGLTPLEKEMLNAILRILEERGEEVSRMIHERLIRRYKWSVRTYYDNEVAYSHFESREEAEKLVERLRKAGIRAEVIPFRREYIE